MVPAGVVLLTLTRLMHREMAECRAAKSMAWMAMLAAALNAALLLGAPLITDASATVLVERGTATFWPLAILLSMLSYARHVMYVTNEPAPVEAGGAGNTGRVGRWWAALRTARAERRAERERAQLAAKAAKKLKQAASRTKPDDDDRSTSRAAAPASDRKSDSVQSPKATPTPSAVARPNSGAPSPPAPTRVMPAGSVVRPSAPAASA
jgi:hypothetical protein